MAHLADYAASGVAAHGRRGGVRSFRAACGRSSKMFGCRCMCSTSSAACSVFSVFSATWIAAGSSASCVTGLRTGRKELAVMCLILLAYEIWFGRRERKMNWIPLAVFFMASLSFGVQGILFNPNKNNDYTFRFTAAAALTTFSFYGSKIFLAPYAGFLLPIGAALSKIGAPGSAWLPWPCFSCRYFFLPGRLFAAYCYVPFTGLAIAFSGLAEAFGLIPLAAFSSYFCHSTIARTPRNGRRLWAPRSRRESVDHHRRPFRSHQARYRYRCLCRVPHRLRTQRLRRRPALRFSRSRFSQRVYR